MTRITFLGAAGTVTGSRLVSAVLAQLDWKVEVPELGESFELEAEP